MMVKQKVAFFWSALLVVTVLSAPSQAAGSNTRRITQQFSDWTMACVEDKSAQSKLCNVSQDIFGPSGVLAFHWELIRDPTGNAKGSLSIAPLLPSSVVVLRLGADVTVIGDAKCLASGCTASFGLSSASTAELSKGHPASVQFIYLNASGSVLGLRTAGFGEAWAAASSEMGDKEMIASIPQRSLTKAVRPATK